MYEKRKRESDAAWLQIGSLVTVILSAFLFPRIIEAAFALGLWWWSWVGDISWAGGLSWAFGVIDFDLDGASFWGVVLSFVFGLPIMAGCWLIGRRSTSQNGAAVGAVIGAVVGSPPSSPPWLSGPSRSRSGRRSSG